MNVDNDFQLLQKFIAGDESAFVQIYDAYFDQLVAYGSGLGGEKKDLEDAIQDIFLKLYSDKRMLNNVREIRFYLFRALRNTILNTYKSKSRLKNIDDYEFTFSTKIDTLDNIIEEEERIYIKRKLDGYLNSLTDRQREVVFLRFIQGLEYDEIGLLLNIAPTSTRNIVALAIKKMRNMNMVSIFILFISELR